MATPRKEHPKKGGRPKNPAARRLASVTGYVGEELAEKIRSSARRKGLSLASWALAAFEAKLAAEETFPPSS